MSYYYVSRYDTRTRETCTLGVFTTRRDAVYCIDNDTHTSPSRYHIEASSVPPLRYNIFGIHKDTDEYIEVGTFLTRESAYEALYLLYDENVTYYIDEMRV